MDKKEHIKLRRLERNFKAKKWDKIYDRYDYLNPLPVKFATTSNTDIEELRQQINSNSANHI